VTVVTVLVFVEVEDDSWADEELALEEEDELEEDVVSGADEDVPDEPGEAEEVVDAEDVVEPVVTAFAEAQEHTARAADWTCRTLEMPHAEMTQA